MDSSLIVVALLMGLAFMVGLTVGEKRGLRDGTAVCSSVGETH